MLETKNQLSWSMKRLLNWKLALGIYLLWATAHLLIFCFNTPYDSAKETFWPWSWLTWHSSTPLRYYDPTELGVYLALPIILYLSFTLIFIARQTKITRGPVRDRSTPEEQIHILEGLVSCSDSFEEVTRIISTSTTRRRAVEALMTELALSELQAIAIMSAELQRFTKVEDDRLRDELDQLTKELRDSKSRFPFEGSSLRHPAPGETPAHYQRVHWVLILVTFLGGPIGYGLIQLYKYLAA